MSSTDQTFERFRRKLADVVTVAINSGKRVSANRTYVTDHCPLGCHPLAKFPRAWSSVAPFFGITEVEAGNFTEGFDLGRNHDEYARLGCLYRARFP